MSREKISTKKGEPIPLPAKAGSFLGLIFMKEVDSDTDFVLVFILKETYELLSKIAVKKRITVPAAVAEALSKYITKENEP